MVNPPFGQIVSGPESFRIFKNAIENVVNRRIVIASAYAKLPTLVEVGKHISDSNAVLVLARWQPRDLVVGSSDLGCFLYAQERGWQFYVRQDFHGKVYFVDEVVILVGSANLTGAGSGVTPISNEEAMVPVESNIANRARILQFFETATLVTSALYQAMQDYVEAQKNQIGEIANNHATWPRNILDALKPTSSSDLLVAETFWSNGAWLADPTVVEGNAFINEAIAHDASLLGNVSAEQVKKLDVWHLIEAITCTKFYRWLLIQLRQAPEHQLYFGSLTAQLHDALIDDPKPYRQDVKVLLANLLSWIQVANVAAIKIDRPNYSQRIRAVL